MECQSRCSSGREHVADTRACPGEAGGHNMWRLETCWPWDR